MMRKRIALLLAAVMLTGLLAACGSPTAQESESAAPAETEAVAEETAQPATQTVVDAAGREVTLPAQVETVATYGGCAVLVTIVETLGCADRLCNRMAPSFYVSDTYAMHEKFAPEMLSKPYLENAAGEILIEEVLRINPDLNLTLQTQCLNTLEDNDIPVVFIDWANGEELKENVRLIADILDVEERGEAYCDYFDETVAKAEQIVAQIPESERKTVLFADVTNRYINWAISEWWIEEGGGISVSKEMHTGERLDFTTEDLLAWDPDVIFTTSDQKEEIMADSQLAGITAVQNGEIYRTPCVGHQWGVRTTEQQLVILWTINKLYPEYYSYDELAEDIHYFYETFMNYDMPDNEIEQVINNGIIARDW